MLADLFCLDLCRYDELAGLVTVVMGLIVKRTAVASTGYCNSIVLFFLIISKLG